MSHPLGRAIQPWAEELLGFTPALVIEGARRTGKSTFNLDDIRTLPLSTLWAGS